jgi:hypothetical protein|tara:strand:- start:2064 stop:3812 length:1749 start_codon:yes stop_codon:yes gene_type:complete
MAKVSKINHNCKHCKKELHPDNHQYYKCDDCGGYVCDQCHVKHEGKELCKHCHHKTTNQIMGMPAGTVKIGAFVGALLLLAVFFTFFTSVGTPTGYALINNFNENSGADASLDLFVMSQCPYGTMAEDLVMPIVEDFGSDVNFNLYFIANPAGDGFSSLHGQPEVDEDMRQLYIIKNNPEKFFDYLECFNPDYRNPEASFEACADELGLDADAITSFIESDEGKALFAENIQKSTELGIGGSPTFYINGEPYQGARSESAITRALCVDAPKAKACKDLPEEKVVSMKLVNDENCELCDTSSLIGQIKTIIPGLKVENIEYDSEEGQALIQTFGATSVPLMVFDSSVSESSGFANLEQYLVPQGDQHMLRVPGVKFLDREEQPGNVKLFIMSQCPYGTIAQGTLGEVVEAMPDLDWEIFFIANDNGDGTFESLHGQPEVQEDMLQTCILKYVPEHYFEYAEEYKNAYDACGAEMQTTQDYGAYQSCLATIDTDSIMKKIGINTGQMLICMSSFEGPDLLTTNVALADSLEIGASPTFLFNNNIIGGGSTAESLKQSICALNPGMTGCDQVLSQNAAAAGSGQC